MKVAVFLTADRAAAAELLAAWRARWPDATMVAFANDEDRSALQATAPDIQFRRDKAPGGKVQFLRALRAERFDLALAAWHGGERLQPLRIVALLLGCPAIVIDERGRERPMAWWQPWRWGLHLLRRCGRADALQAARFAAWLYRMTVGACIGVVWIPLRACLSQLRR